MNLPASGMEFHPSVLLRRIRLRYIRRCQGREARRIPIVLELTDWLGGNTKNYIDDCSWARHSMRKPSSATTSGLTFGRMIGSSQNEGDVPNGVAPTALRASLGSQKLLEISITGKDD